MKEIDNRIKRLEDNIHILTERLNELKEEVEADSKGMNSIDGRITFKAFGCDCIIESRVSGKYRKCGLWLSKRFTWEIVRDDWGCTCLIITGLNEEEGQ